MKESETRRVEEHESDGCEVCAMLGIEDVILIEELERRGVRVRRPEELEGESLAAAIAELGRELAKLRVFIEYADHLSDEELYRRLYYETLQEWSWISPDDPMSATHIDMCCSGSDEDHLAWLTYYADDEDRADAVKWDPNFVLPERRTPPFDRSGVLPPATYADEPDM